MNVSTAKNGRVEFLRFCFALLVVYHHLVKFFLTRPGQPKPLGYGGYFAVEFFFVLSGYLLAKHLHKKQKQENYLKEIGPKTLSYLWKRIIAVFPCHAFGFIIFLLATISWKSFSQSLFFVIKAIPTLFFFSPYIGFLTEKINTPIWYLSALFLSILLLYPIGLKYFSFWSHIGAPLCYIFCSIILHGQLSPASTINGFPVSILLALAYISLGNFSYIVSQKISNCPSLSKNKHWISFIFWSSFLIIVTMMIFNIISGKFQQPASFFIFLLVSSAFLLQDNNFFALPIIFFLGKFSLHIYLLHVPAIKIIISLIPENLSFYTKSLLSIMLTFSFGFVFHFFLIFIKNNNHVFPIKGSTIWTLRK